MLTEDYIMRIISQALAVLMVALGLKKSGQYQEALVSFDQAKEILLGLNRHLVDQLDDSALLDLLTSNERLDLERLVILADLYKEEGEIFKLLEQVNNSVTANQRSLRLYLEAFLANDLEKNTEIILKIEVIRPQLDLLSLPELTCLALLDYFDRLSSTNNDFLTSVGISRDELQSSQSLLNTNCNIDRY